MKVRDRNQGKIAVSLTLGMALLLGGAVVGVGQAATLGPQSAGYAPGETSLVPIVLALGSDEADRAAFSLQVIPGTGAPALTSNLGFVAGAGLPSPMVSANTTQISVAWLMPFSSTITGTVTLGHVSVPIPSGASAGDSYTVHMLSVGASLGAEEIPTSLGADVVLGGAAGPPVITITITLQELGVEVTPTAWNLGVMSPEDFVSSWVSGEPGYFAAANIGNVSEDFTISAGATSPSGWTPGAAAGTDVYLIGFGFAEDPYTTEPAYTPFDDGGEVLASGVPVAEAVAFDLAFTAPAADSTGGDSETFVISLAAAP